MILTGQSITLSRLIGSTYTPFTSSTTCSMSIDTDYIEHYLSEDSTSPRTSSHTRSIRSWSIEMSAFINSTDFSALVTSMRNGQPISILFTAPYTNRTLKVTGQALITRLSFSADGNGLVSYTLSAIGNGAPTPTIS